MFDPSGPRPRTGGGLAGRATTSRDLARRKAVASVDERYTVDEGTIYVTGVQALVRMALDQRRADRRAGLRTAMFVSGYQGSPLGTLDKELARQKHLADQYEIVHQPGLNEELGATAVWGSQVARNLPGARYDGVLGMWYAKAPGLDRAADALRHANWIGVDRRGGALALVGDDPTSKSSTLPSASESMLAELGMPVFYPGHVQEVIDLGLHGFALSRISGLWTGVKMVTNVADGHGTADVGPERIRPSMPDRTLDGIPFSHRPDANILSPRTLELEASLFDQRLSLARRYIRDNALNRVEGADDGWLGIVVAGKSYYDLWDALRQLGLNRAELETLGVRILKLAVVWPLDSDLIKTFARGLKEVLVIEEKRPFIERQVKDSLYAAGAPLVVGKRDQDGIRLLAEGGELDPEAIAVAVVSRLHRRLDVSAMNDRLAQLQSLARLQAQPAPVSRTPFFCSGCPHNRSTYAPEHTLVGAGIGCHAMVLLNASGKGAVTGLTQMGGEGAQWVGMAPFTDDDHFVQNVGDGTFFHSASLAVRFAVASGQNITFKILVNDAVAMTGGQAVEGSLPVPALTHLLSVKGAKEIVVTTDEPQRYRGVTLGVRTSVRDRRHLLEVQQRLSKVPGVTILIHDQQCAAEKRRLRKRGKIQDPPKRVVINERVCEGCGDCGRKSDCLSVRPVDTPFGRKTQIHQASCNKDFSCLDGDCPSFITVVGDVNGKPSEIVLPEVTLRLPTFLARPDDFSVRMTGVGGTGVVTMSQVLGMAARLEGKHVWGLDQTGLSQKGGQVVSDVRFAEEPGPRANRIPAGGADLYLAFDLLAGTSPKNLVACSPQRTAVVASTSAVPTGTMVTDQDVEFPALDDLIGRVRARARDQQCLLLDAEALSEALFHDDVQANAITIGAAFQQGFLPLQLESIERAFQLNGASVAKNLAAFAWGRACVAAPEVVQRRLGRADETAAPGPVAAHAAARLAGGPALQQLVAVRFEELCAYQNERYANRYLEFVGLAEERVRERIPSAQDELTSAIAHSLHKLMAYKDEYEVARLHLDASEQARIRAQFGAHAKMRWHLHPPMLRALGLNRKLVFGPWFSPAFSALRGMRRLRGTWLDPFGRATVRRVERDLIGEYETAINLALEHLTVHNYSLIVRIAELPDMVRGYEEIKLANVASYRAEMHRLLASLSQPSPEDRALVLWT